MIPYGDWKLFIQTKHDPDRADIWVQGFGWSLQDLPFNVVHFLLAWQYKRLSNDIPQILSGVELSTSNQTLQKIVYWTLLILNIVVPLLELLF